MRQSTERGIKIFSWISGIVFLLVLSTIVLYLVYKGLGSINKALIFGETPAIDAFLLISASALAVLVLPYILRSTQYALESLPAETKIIAPALGATKLQNIAYVLLPRSSAGIASGIILAIGRSAEAFRISTIRAIRSHRCAARSEWFFRRQIHCR
jgi:ABC-type phosphate transport system permease subunit